MLRKDLASPKSYGRWTELNCTIRDQFSVRFFIGWEVEKLARECFDWMYWFLCRRCSCVEITAIFLKKSMETLWIEMFKCLFENRKFLKFKRFNTLHFMMMYIKTCGMLRNFPTIHRWSRKWPTARFAATVSISTVKQRKNRFSQNLKCFSTRKTLVQFPEFLIQKNVNIIYVENCWNQQRKAFTNFWMRR